jgi:hypothetical protein
MRSFDCVPEEPRPASVRRGGRPVTSRRGVAPIGLGHWRRMPLPAIGKARDRHARHEAPAGLAGLAAADLLRKDRSAAFDSEPGSLEYVQAPGACAHSADT